MAVRHLHVVWHSPLPRAEASATILGQHLPGVPVQEAGELVDHVPQIPTDPPPVWARMFDGYDAAAAAAGRRLADALIERFVRPAETDTHEVLVTHAYQVAWLVRHALDAPPERWLALTCGTAALTSIDVHDGSPPTVVLFNDMGHLAPDLRWTGFRPVPRP